VINSSFSPNIPILLGIRRELRKEKPPDQAAKVSLENLVAGLGSPPHRAGLAQPPCVSNAGWRPLRGAPDADLMLLYKGGKVNRNNRLRSRDGLDRRDARGGIVNSITIFFDDSGTHPESSIALAACYASTVEQWKELERNWNEAKRDAQFNKFDMVEFAAGRGEFAGWSDTKKRRVLLRLCSIINTRVEVGYAVAVRKRIYDTVIKNPFRVLCGQFHYTFAVRHCATSIADWRRKHHKAASMKYIFDQMSTNQGKGEIMTVMDAAITKSERESRTTGVPPLTGYSFESKTSSLPLQAADILAWTTLQQMHKRLSKRNINWIAQLAWQELASFRGTLD